MSSTRSGDPRLGEQAAWVSAFLGAGVGQLALSAWLYYLSIDALLPWGPALFLASISWGLVGLWFLGQSLFGAVMLVIDWIERGKRRE